MKKKIIILSAILAGIVILAGFTQAVGTSDVEEIQEQQNVVIEICRYYGKKTEPILTEVSEDEAQEIIEILTNLNHAIETNDEEAIKQYETILNEKGIFGDNYQEFFSQDTFSEKAKTQKYQEYFPTNGDNVDNNLCYFNALGKGIMVFTLGIRFLEAIIRAVENASSFLAGLILLLALLPFFVLIMLFTHLVPFRILLSRGIVGIKEGNMFTLGLQGFKKMDSFKNETYYVNISGFTGLTINIPNFGQEEGTFLFVSGIAIGVKETP